MVVHRAAAVAVSAERAGEENRARVSILGVPLDVVGFAQAKKRVESFLAGPWDGRCRHIVTLNPEYVMAAGGDTAFAAAIAGGDLITADGVGVELAARLLGGKAVARVTGSDLVDWLVGASDRTAAPVFLLGGREGVAAEAAQRLVERFPAASIAGWWSGGSAAVADDAEALARIRGSGARTVLVAYGAPGQVVWIARNRQALAAAGVRVAVGIGGVLDFVAGRAPRAPGVMRRLGLEWLYRLIREPWRWRRQAVLPVFAWRIWLEWLWRRGNRAGKIARPK
jgi:N-acetylglucosaminyldiphosphoundecaprenol N-acetyl-beta-D-mannosaminyltransferase